MVLTTYVSMWCIRLGVTLTRLAEVCCVPCVVTASWQELQNVTAARLWAASSLTCPTSQGPKQHAHQEKKSSGGLKIDHQWDYGTLLQLASDGIHGAGWPRSCIPSQSHPPLTVLGGELWPRSSQMCRCSVPSDSARGSTTLPRIWSQQESQQVQSNWEWAEMM